MHVNINLKYFNQKLNKGDIKKLSNYLSKIYSLEWPKFFKSFKSNYKYSYSKTIINRYQKYKDIHVIGMGGSSLGAKAIYSFFKKKIKKKFRFSENLNLEKIKKKKNLNIVISKSGNTLETIVNFN